MSSFQKASFLQICWRGNYQAKDYLGDRDLETDRDIYTLIYRAAHLLAVTLGRVQRLSPPQEHVTHDVLAKTTTPQPPKPHH